jgi:hypothetical protein
MVKDEEKYESILNTNLASKYAETHLMMTRQVSKHVVININVNNLCYYFYLNCCADGYKYNTLNGTQQDATRKAKFYIYSYKRNKNS